MDQFEHTPAVPYRGVSPHRADYERFLNAIGNRRSIYVRVVRGINVVKFERPGDDRDMRRGPESTFPGDIIKLELDPECRHMQTPREISVLLAAGKLAPSSRSEFDKSEPHAQVEAKRQAAALEQRKRDANLVPTLVDRVRGIELLLAQFAESAAQKKT